MKKLPMTLHIHSLLLRQDGAHASLPNGLGGTQGLPLLYSLDCPRLEEIEDTHAMISIADDLVADRAGHFDSEDMPSLRAVRFNSQDIRSGAG